jgi:hypothetical protein
MSNFNIQVISEKPETHNRRKYHRGRITIDDFTETFRMPYDSWTIDEYQQQWKEGLERIKTHNSSCLIATLSGLKKNYPFILLWVLYKEKNVIYIQNKLLFDEIFEEISQGLPPFSAETCYLYFGSREIINEDGDKLSEWKTDMNAINDFLEKQYYQSPK